MQKVDLAHCLSKIVCVDKFIVVGIEYEQERQPESSSGYSMFLIWHCHLSMGICSLKFS